MCLWTAGLISVLTVPSERSLCSFQIDGFCDFVSRGLETSKGHFPTVNEIEPSGLGWFGLDSLGLLCCGAGGGSVSRPVG